MAPLTRSSAARAAYPRLTSPSQTRLVTLHDVREDGDFEAHLEVVDLDAKPRVEFQALSYLCGDSTPRSKVHLVGTVAHVRIPQNLTDAIRRLLNDGYRSPIWIDAISINQSDIAERNQQVRLMTRIYAGASTVLVSIDLNTPDFSHTVSVLERWADPFGDPQMSSQARQEFSRICDLSQPFSDSRFMPYIHALFQRMTEVESTALAILCGSDYFRRSWVVQEAASGHRLQVLLSAKDKVEWDTLAWAARWLNVVMVPDGDTRRDHCRQIMDRIRLLDGLRNWKQGEGKIDLKEFTQAFGYQSQDPKDKLFAVAGIFNIPESVEHHFKVDYNRSTWFVYAEATRGTIKATQMLLLLSFDDFHPSAPADSPSWVPSSECSDFNNFHIANKCAYIRGSGSIGKLPHVATGEHAEVKDVEDARILALLGVDNPDTIVDLIELDRAGPWQLAVVFLSLRKRQACYKEREFAVAFAEATTHRYAFEAYQQNMSSKDVFWDFRAYLRRYMRTPSVYDDTEDSLITDLDTWDEEDARKPGEDTLQRVGNANHYFSGMNNTCWRSNLVILSSGRIAVTSKKAQVGDSIVVLLGGNMPFVLRPHSDTKDWERISIAWVTGIMDGELLRDPTRKREWYSLV